MFINLLLNRLTADKSPNFVFYNTIKHKLL